MVALGNEICGLFTDDDALAAEMADVSKVSGDTSWRLRMIKLYRAELNSKFADLQQTIGTHNQGGSISAALFFQNVVVDEKVPSTRHDIAGPVWCDKTGATGFGTRMIVEWVSRQGK
jgi:leucyl aminopeptidase